MNSTLRCLIGFLMVSSSVLAQEGKVEDIRQAKDKDLNAVLMAVGRAPGVKAGATRQRSDMMRQIAKDKGMSILSAASGEHCESFVKDWLAAAATPELQQWIKTNCQNKAFTQQVASQGSYVTMQFFEEEAATLAIVALTPAGVRRSLTNAVVAMRKKGQGTLNDADFAAFEKRLETWLEDLEKRQLAAEHRYQVGRGRPAPASQPTSKPASQPASKPASKPSGSKD